MADDKTEKPTPKRLRDARKKGQVSKSSDLTQSVLFLTAATVLSFTGPALVEQLKAFMIESFSPKLMAGSLDPGMLMTRIGNASIKFLLLSMPLLAALAIAAIAVNFLQLQGFLFAPEALTPNFTKLNPVTGLQNILFKPKTYLELVKNLLKFIIILWLAYSTLSSFLRDLIVSGRLGIAQIAGIGPPLLFHLLFKVGGVFLLFGAADFAMQKQLFMKGLMMSKEEIKREYKEEEGDPHVKGHRKALYMALLRENATKQVPKAKAVVVNPTHIAVALQYEDTHMNAPRVVAKGEMLLAQKIIQIAKSHNVPVIRNIKLARSLFTLELEEEIPEELYETVAEILNLASRLENEN
ncbi:EscU/YscU/HrcU family type III secretion system export apparatus switch protein [Edaphobacter aggregans]|uniref:EscU/YscU/HrcU family type III secretion system export apparatus switch protein n=1 Tax=Edaphobacter aggregans TaxID=570835 RepID=UPI000554BF15|nr:EscU/YscU/HrcU family type III secretion system export apparatus switch protein [Edaphobacter aggregans]